MIPYPFTPPFYLPPSCIYLYFYLQVFFISKNCPPMYTLPCLPYLFTWCCRLWLLFACAERITDCICASWYSWPPGLPTLLRILQATFWENINWLPLSAPKKPLKDLLAVRCLPSAAVWGTVLSSERPILPSSPIIWLSPWWV